MQKGEFSSRLPDEQEEFYTLTLLGENGSVYWATQTQWVAFTEGKPPRDIREARKVYASFADLWRRVGQPFVVARLPEEVLAFRLKGGHALIEPRLFEAEFPEFLAPRICIPDGLSGFSSASHLDLTALRRNPTPKLRMQILNRDARKCRICGRKPDDHIDLELHVHHIRPWSSGGITEPKNLITLCNTCHRGLEPHFDPSLYSYISPERFNADVAELAKRHVEGVMEYRKVLWAGELKEDPE